MSFYSHNQLCHIFFNDSGSVLGVMEGKVIPCEVDSLPSYFRMPLGTEASTLLAQFRMTRSGSVLWLHGLIAFVYISVK